MYIGPHVMLFSKLAVIWWHKHYIYRVRSNETITLLHFIKSAKWEIFLQNPTSNSIPSMLKKKKGHIGYFSTFATFSTYSEQANKMLLRFLWNVEDVLSVFFGPPCMWPCVWLFSTMNSHKKSHIVRWIQTIYATKWWQQIASSTMK